MGRLHTCYSPVRRSPAKVASYFPDAPRLACVKPVASVHPEPGSNSSLLFILLFFFFQLKKARQTILFFVCCFHRDKILWPTLFALAFQFFSPTADADISCDLPVFKVELTEPHLFFLTLVLLSMSIVILSMSSYCFAVDFYSSESGAKLLTLFFLAKFLADFFWVFCFAWLCINLHRSTLTIIPHCLPFCCRCSAKPLPKSECKGKNFILPYQIFILLLTVI